MPVDATNALVTAISIAKMLREVSDKVNDAVFKLLIAAARGRGGLVIRAFP